MVARSGSGRPQALGFALVIGAVALWINNARRLQELHKLGLWDKPFATGLGLKAAHFIGLPPALVIDALRQRRAMSRSRWARERS